MTAPQSPSSPKRDRDQRAATDDSPTKRRRQGVDGLTTPPPSTLSAVAGPSSSSSPRRRSPRLVQRVAGQTQAGPSGPFDAISTMPSGTTAPRRRPAQTQAPASASTSHSSPIMPLRSRTAPGPCRSAGSLGLESETGCRRPTAAVAPTMRPPPPRPSTSGGPSDPPSSSPSSLFSRRPLGEMTLADADRQARAIRSRHEEVEERLEAAAEAAQQQATTMGSSDYPPATPSRSPATGATRRTFSLGRRSTPRRTASSSSSTSAGPSIARRGPPPPTSSVAFTPSSDGLNADEASFSTSSIFDDSLASTASASTSAADAMPSTPRDGQQILGVAEMAAAARYHASPSSPSGVPRTPSRRRGQATSDAAGQAQLESPPSDENDDSPGRERRRRREAAAAVAAMAAEKARHEEEEGGAGGEGEDGEPVLLEKGDYREVIAGRAMRGGSLVGGSR